MYATLPFIFSFLLYFLKRHRQRFQPPQRHRLSPFQFFRLQAQVGHATKQRVDGDLRFDAGKRCAQAVVNAVAKSNTERASIESIESVESIGFIEFIGFVEFIELEENSTTSRDAINPTNAIHPTNL
jgi:hypothetical protein